jgi:Xaa-Pro aminopeptidase
MMPVNGRFSDAQRELYGVYKAFYEAILHRIRPGATAQEIKREAGIEMRRILDGRTFSKDVYRQAAEAFVSSYERGAESPNTRLGHGVGMATHDVGTFTGPLREGMVFTIEPALRVPEEEIYIRLEDVIIIHADRAEIASDFVPREMADIERLMVEEGILQKYPKDEQPPAGTE